MPIDRRTFLHTAAASALAVAAHGCGRAAGDVQSDRSQRLAELVVGPGGWCWFQSPRAAIDRQGTLWIGSTRGTSAPSAGRVEVSEVDLERGEVRAHRPIGHDRVDDHTSPSVLPIGQGVQVGWAPHRRADWVELGELGRPLDQIRRPQALTPPGRGTAYVSAHVVGDERWVLYRGEGFTWNLLTSPDGRRWRAKGAVVRGEPVGQRPYVCAASDGERLHLVASDGNPTEGLGTGVGCGSIGRDLTIADAAGRPVGAVGTAAPTPRALTRLLEGRAGHDEADDTDAWACQLAVVHRRPTAILSLRDPWPGDGPTVGGWRHRLLWARQRSTGRWTVEHLAWGGSELYRNQPDYCGLGTVDSLDPRRVVISTDVHPVTGLALRSAADGQVHHELFEGHRVGEGRWQWSSLTSNSTVDHLRPLLVAGAGRAALVWMRGTYRSWTDFDTDIVVRIA